MWLGSMLLIGACAPRSGGVVDRPGPQPLHAIAWEGSASIIEPPMKRLAAVIGDVADDPAAAAATLRQRIAEAQQQLGDDHATTRHLRLMLALVCEENGQFDEARGLYQRIEADHRTALASTSQPLADALRAHGIMEAKAGHPRAGQPLIDEAMTIYDTRDRYGNRRRTTVRGAAGMCHALDGNLQAAIEDHNAAVKMLPSDPRVYRDRAVTLLIAGQWAAARDDMVKAFRFRQDPINDAMAMIWLACAAAGDVGTADRVLQQLFDQQPTNAPRDIHERIGRYLRHELTEDDLRAAAATPYAWRHRYNQCLVAYFIAHRRRADGDEAGYREALGRCLDTQVQACWALHAAKREVMMGASPVDSAR
jgi:tetratricopeptide (TPR) repeat protein